VGRTVVKKSASDYNRWREAFENRVDGNEKDFAYGAITSPVLRDILRRFRFCAGAGKLFKLHENGAKYRPVCTAISYGRSEGTNPRIPMRYEWGPEATANASLAWGDSLRGAPFFKNVDDFKAAINKGITEVENTPGKADWGVVTRKMKNSSISIPDYIEAQIPKLTIDDISRITALGERPGDAAAQGINIVDALTAAGKDIPVSAQSFNVPKEIYKSEFRRTGVLDELSDNPAYANILNEILDQRSNFCPLIWLIKLLLTVK